MVAGSSKESLQRASSNPRNFTQFLWNRERRLRVADNNAGRELHEQEHFCYVLIN